MIVIINWISEYWPLSGFECRFWKLVYNLRTGTDKSCEFALFVDKFLSVDQNYSGLDELTSSSILWFWCFRFFCFNIQVFVFLIHMMIIKSGYFEFGVRFFMLLIWDMFKFLFQSVAVAILPWLAYSFFFLLCFNQI